MKIEKINENKVKITLTLDELENRKISLKDLEKNSTLAKELFFDLIEENNLDEELMLEDSQLLIEASSDNENLFIVTITKVDLPACSMKPYSNEDNKIRPAKNRYYKISSTIYAFDSIDVILDFCEKCKSENLFFGRNSLYKYNDSYFILFTKNAVKDKRFIKTFTLLSEYCSNYFDYDMLTSTIKEKSKIIISNNALQKLISL